MKHGLRAMATFAMSLCLVVGLSACASSKAELLKLGSPSDNTEMLLIANKTGQEIKLIELKDAEGADCGQNLVPESGFAQDAQAELYVPKASGQPQDVAVNQTFEVKIGLADGSEYVLHDVVFSIMKDAQIKFEQGACYIQFINKDSSETQDTRAAEIAYQDRKEQEAAARAQVQAAAEAQAAAQANAAKKDQQSQASKNVSTEQKPQRRSQNNKPQNHNNGEDVCVDDLVLND